MKIFYVILTCKNCNFEIVLDDRDLEEDDGTVCPKCKEINKFVDPAVKIREA
jgi:hypothetical protein